MPASLIPILIVVGALLAFSWVRSVPQATVAVITVFGKYRRIMREGLNFKLPWESVFQRLSLQNRALQLEFQAITLDQANVKFATMVLYAVANADEDSIKKAVFSFASAQEFQLALQRTIDGSIRQFVATTSSQISSACAPRLSSIRRKTLTKSCPRGVTWCATSRSPT
jgi:regulator of protease activity HflC (stomatin/prohibitin superfamily)